MTAPSSRPPGTSAEGSPSSRGPREAFRVMEASGGGAIVSIASVSSVVAFATQTAYAASKGALAQITRVLAIEGGPKGIRSNAVLPGVIDTDIMEGVVENGREMLA